MPPVDRPENLFFDPGAKYHIVSNDGYMRLTFYLRILISKNDLVEYLKKISSVINKILKLLS